MIRRSLILISSAFVGMGLFGCNKDGVPICPDDTNADPDSGQCVCGPGYIWFHQCCTGTTGPGTTDCRLPDGTVVEKDNLGQDTDDPTDDAPEGTDDIFYVEVRSLQARRSNGQFFPVPGEEFNVSWIYFNPNNGALLPAEDYPIYQDEIVEKPTFNINSEPNEVEREVPWGSIAKGEDESWSVPVTADGGSYVAQIFNLPVVDPSTTAISVTVGF